MNATGPTTRSGRPKLARALTLLPAVALAMVDMIGVGPFATLPNLVNKMGGAQAIYGWTAGALLAMCDGLIWAELGAAMPKAGGSYEYLGEIYGREKLGRLFSFLFVFQLIVSAPISIATGCVGLAGYASYVFPSLEKSFFQANTQFRFFGFTFMGSEKLAFGVSGATLVAMAAALLATFLVYRRITGVGRIAKFLWVGVLGTMGFVIFAGLTHFHSSLAFPAGWSRPQVSGFWTGFSAALLIALYDYWGYYNVCFLGEEIAEPRKTIPRAMLLSIAVVAILYITMNISILGVVPFAELHAMAMNSASSFVAARAVQLAYGHWAGTLVAIMVIWTAFASVFALLAGYSRVPFAAARDGNFFRFFEKLHPKHNFPGRSVLFLGLMAAAFSVFSLGQLVTALVVIRILLMFGLQAVGVVVWRIVKPDQPRPFRMWLYPLPVLITLAGFALVLHDKKPLYHRALVFAAIGVLLFLVRAVKNRTWPFARAQANA
ncbi:MAG TPA: APC family permease [Methylomirabilota bacterium]|nr:APC family permease [Methylomirabilota bacterium]